MVLKSLTRVSPLHTRLRRVSLPVTPNATNPLGQGPCFVYPLHVEELNEQFLIYPSMGKPRSLTVLPA